VNVVNNGPGNAENVVVTDSLTATANDRVASNTPTAASTTFDPFASNNSSTKVVLSGNPPKP
jgi:hypothetical protein